MPEDVFKPGFQFLPKNELLSFEEISRLVMIFNQLGVRKVRLTGGEPLLRQNIEILVELLARIPGLEVTITTNGSLLTRKAHLLKNAGLDRVTVSLDSLDNDIFQMMNGDKCSVKEVLEGIKAAEDAGFKRLKINMIVKRDINVGSIIPMAKFFYRSNHILRFIEFMDVGNSNAWQLNDVVPATEIIDLINFELPIEPLEENYRGEVAKRWRYKDGNGEIGLITSVTNPFCGDCTRVRLSAKGILYTCLFASEGYDLRHHLRSNTSDDEIRDQISSIWQNRIDRYSETRGVQKQEKQKIEMSYIGG
jgi:cyclic pyranopterin phosphate synthase